MATFNNFCMGMAFVISYALLLKTSLSSRDLQPSQGPSIETNYAPQPMLSSYEAYLTECAAKLDPHCGDQIFFNIIYGNRTVSSECCFNLVFDMGYSCHRDMTNYAVESPKFEHDKDQISQRSQKVWNECSSSPSPQPIGVEV